MRHAARERIEAERSEICCRFTPVPRNMQTAARRDDVVDASAHVQERY